MRPHHRVLKNIADELSGTKKGGGVHERDFESREAFEAEARRRCRGSVIVYSTDPVELADVSSGFVTIQLPEVDELPGANG